MKKIISFVLIVMLFPFTFLLASCGKDDGYQLKNLKSDFYATVKNYENIDVFNNKFVFNYARHVDKNGIKYFENAVNNKKPYTAIANYNELFQNMMAFSYSTVEICSDNSIKAGKRLRNEIKDCLDDLKSDFGDINTSMNNLSDRLQFDSSSNNTNRLVDLLKSYDSLFATTKKLNGLMTKLYFNHALEDSYVNYTVDVKLENFQPDKFLSTLNTRIKFEISNLSVCYYEMVFKNQNLENEVVKLDSSIYGKLNFEANDYKNNITKIISKEYNLEQIQAFCETANNSANKEEVFNLVATITNLQGSIKNETEKFEMATKNIAYLSVKADTKASAKQQEFAGWIEEFNTLVAEYNTALTALISTIGG